MGSVKFRNDETALLETFLDGVVFNKSRDYTSNRNEFPDNRKGYPRVSEGMGIELIVRPECNQKCEYCYITQHGDELYPVHERVDNATILRNLRAILEYVYYEKHSFVNRWELFAGDLFYDNLYFDLLDIFYDVIKPIYKTYHHLFTRGRKISILSPSNCSFVKDDNKVALFEQYCKKMEEVGCELILSYSTDGKYACDSREKYDVPDEVFDKTFAFLKRHHYGPHPMVSAENIDNYIKNYDWWVEQIPKFSDYDTSVMMLEVRNDNWTEEKLDKYEALLKHIVHQNLKLHPSKKDFAQHLFDERSDAFGYNLIKLYPKRSYEDDAAYSCSMQWLLHITLNNLSIVPCHRTSYKQFLIGQFDQDETGKITGVTGNNVAIGITTHGFRAGSIPRCSKCKYAPGCVKGCLGSQYEHSGELFAPIDSVCRLLKRKISVLSREYRDLGLLDIALENKYITNELYNLYMSWCEEEVEEPWVTISRNSKQ